MINYYPFWKNVGVFFVLIAGLVYTLPNIYTGDYAILIRQHISSNQNPDNTLLSNVNQIVASNKIVLKNIYLNKDEIRILFFCESDQYSVYKILSAIFSEQYSIFCSKVVSIPCWLTWIKAKPVKLGLDLKGGLYLLVKVDMITALNKFQDQYLDILRSVLKEKNILYVKIYKKNDSTIQIIFKNLDDKNKAMFYFSKEYSNLIFSPVENYSVNVLFSENYIRSIYEYIMQQNVTILKHRIINQLKILDPIVQCCGDSIIIELPDVQNIAEVKSILNSTASLEFRLVNTTISKFKIDNNFVPEDSEIKMDTSGKIIPVYKKIIVTGNHIVNSDISFDSYNRPQVNISLDDVGSAIISEFTKNNIGKIMATLFIEYKDSGKKNLKGYPILYRFDRVINIATIQSQLSGRFCITGIATLDEARRLSSLLKIGALAAPIFIDEERVIGPTLGKKNITQGIISCSLGILISIFFMIFWYRYFGLIASVALIANLILIISATSLIPGIILTMPSIAGIVLTLSVAIDANVLINERIKEEIRQGKPMQYSIYTGYRKAFVSIVDANVTTIITSVILYMVSNSTIKGFAMITILGVGTSMFTSIIGTRVLVNLIYGKKNIKKLSIGL